MTTATTETTAATSFIERHARGSHKAGFQFAAPRAFADSALIDREVFYRLDRLTTEATQRLDVVRELKRMRELVSLHNLDASLFVEVKTTGITVGLEVSSKGEFDVIKILVAKAAEKFDPALVAAEVEALVEDSEARRKALDTADKIIEEARAVRTSMIAAANAEAEKKLAAEIAAVKAQMAALQEKFAAVATKEFSFLLNEEVESPVIEGRGTAIVAEVLTSMPVPTECFTTRMGTPLLFTKALEFSVGEFGRVALAEIVLNRLNLTADDE